MTRWTRCEDPAERLGATYWDKRVEARWDEPTHGAFGSVEAQRRAHGALREGLLSLLRSGWSCLGANDPGLRLERVLEIGCGYGASSEVIVRSLGGDFQGAKLDYLGTDPCRRYVEQARRLYPQRRFECLDAREVPEQSPSADLVVGVAVLTSLESVLLEVVDRAKRLWLRPGGVILIAEEDELHLWRRP